MQFDEIFTSAWRIIWKHKVLWIFGILAGCGSQGGGGGMNYSIGGNEVDIPGIERATRPLVRFFGGLSAEQNTLLAAVIILAALVLVALAAVLNMIGRVGLIRGAAQADAGSEKLAFGELLASVWPFFWRVLGLNLLVGIALGVIVAFVAGVVILGSVATLGLGLLCLWPLICLLIPLALAVGVILEQANIALVIEDLAITTALQRAWEVVRAQIGAAIVMALVLILGSAVVGVVLALPLGLAVFPAFAAMILGRKGAQALLVTAGLCLVAYLPVLIGLSGVVQAYIKSAWTLFFLRATRPAEVASTAAA